MGCRHGSCKPEFRPVHGMAESWFIPTRSVWTNFAVGPQKMKFIFYIVLFTFFFFNFQKQRELERNSIAVCLFTPSPLSAAVRADQARAGSRELNPGPAHFQLNRQLAKKLGQLSEGFVLGCPIPWGLSSSQPLFPNWCSWNPGETSYPPPVATRLSESELWIREAVSPASTRKAPCYSLVLP